MRIDASLLLLGLATFSNLPAGSARVLYGYASSDDGKCPLLLNTRAI